MTSGVEEVVESSSHAYVVFEAEKQIVIDDKTGEAIWHVVQSWDQNDGSVYTMDSETREGMEELLQEAIDGDRPDENDFPHPTDRSVYRIVEVSRTETRKVVP